MQYHQWRDPSGPQCAKLRVRYGIQREITVFRLHFVTHILQPRATNTLWNRIQLISAQFALHWALHWARPLSRAALAGPPWVSSRPMLGPAQRLHSSCCRRWSSLRPRAALSLQPHGAGAHGAGRRRCRDAPCPPSLPPLPSLARDARLGRRRCADAQPGQAAGRAAQLLVRQQQAAAAEAAVAVRQQGQQQRQAAQQRRARRHPGSGPHRAAAAAARLAVRAQGGALGAARWAGKGARHGAVAAARQQLRVFRRAICIGAARRAAAGGLQAPPAPRGAPCLACDCALARRRCRRGRQQQRPEL
jgi:hypothetical protein